jgi:hypothetical protein
MGFDRDKFMMSERMKEIITRDGRTRKKETKFSKVRGRARERESERAREREGGLYNHCTLL